MCIRDRTKAYSDREAQMTLIKQGTSVVILAMIALIILQISRSINSRVATLLTTIKSISETNDMGIRSTLEGRTSWYQLVITLMTC